MDSLSKVLRQKPNGNTFLKEPNEVASYLQEGTSPHANILDYWKAKQYTLPCLAAMARDILAVPAAGVGVERIFNMARDICHYRRSNLKSDSIRDSMMLKLFDKIELDCEMVSIEDEENPFLDNNAESDNEFEELPDYISDTEHPANTKWKTYKNGHRSKLGKRLKKNLS